MSSTPTVSIIIPSYNAARFLQAAVDSVLGQTYRDIEILVIDDGSTDDTPSIMKRYGSQVRYVRQSNCGVAVARNRGIGESRGKFVAFLDADDTWHSHKLERQLSGLAAHEGHRACYSAIAVATSDLTPFAMIRSQRQRSTLEDLLRRGNIVGTPSTVICERSLFEEVGGFDPALSQCADWDMWVRLAAVTEFLYIDEPLATYRQHGANMSRSASLLESDSLRVLEKGFAMPGLADSLQAGRRAAFARNYMVLAGTYFHARCYRDFARCAARAVAMDFRQAGYLLTFPLRLVSRSRNHYTEPA